ncbi:MAG: hypothetical protein JNN01_14835 [Opitutaceae bacterium]|nr:hypothetical protein [Opitutaceae bacterium]
MLAFARWHDASPTPILIRLARRDPSAPLSRLALRSAITLTDMLEVQHEAVRQLADTLQPEVVKISKSPDTLESAALLHEKTKSRPNGGARP